MILYLLAAGKSRRFGMPDSFTKLTLPLLDKPLIKHVYDNLYSQYIDKVYIVVKDNRKQIEEIITDASYLIQDDRKGTGAALFPLLEQEIDLEESVLIAPADMGCFLKETIINFIEQEKDTDASIIVSQVDNPFGLGRVITYNNQFEKIVEEKELNQEQKKINLVNSGVYLIKYKILKQYLNQLKNDNLQQEYYLTDIFELIKNTYKVSLFYVDKEELIGINNQQEYAIVYKLLQNRINLNLLSKGVFLLDPSNTSIGGDVKIGVGSVIESNVRIIGQCQIGSNVFISSGSRLENVKIDDNVKIYSSYISNSTVEKDATIGPFAHIRNQSIIGEGNRIGNFVEIKKTTTKQGVKIAHLSYIGDSNIDHFTNIGCGVITANFDGKSKWTTNIGQNCFIGCNSVLIAPVNIGDNSIIAANSTITFDVPAFALAIGRTKQINKENYKKD